MVTLFWDRGYGGTDGKVNQWSIAAGVTLLGTAKRMRSFPLTYDQIPGPDRQLIMEKGVPPSIGLRSLSELVPQIHSSMQWQIGMV